MPENDIVLLLGVLAVVHEIICQNVRRNSFREGFTNVCLAIVTTVKTLEVYLFLGYPSEIGKGILKVPFVLFLTDAFFLLLFDH